MVIVDTTVWIDYFRGADNAETAWLEGHLGRQRLGLTDLIVCEVLQGIREQDEFLRTRNELLKLHIFSSGGIEIAVAAARNYRELCNQGYAVRKTIDCIIGTFCLESKHELLHRDRDFDCFETILGMRVVHPEA